VPFRSCSNHSNSNWQPVYLPGCPYDYEASDYVDLTPPEDLTRTIYNPDAKSRVTFLEKAHETDGEYTQLEIELEPGGGNAPHYHEAFSETFTATMGSVGILRGDEKILLEEGGVCNGRPRCNPPLF